MSASKNTPKSPTNKEKHHRQSIGKTVKDEYNQITEAELEEPTEEIQRKELNEPSVVLGHTDVPQESELETIGKPYGSVGSILKEGKTKPLSRDSKVAKDRLKQIETARKGEVVDDDFVNLPDAEKVVEDDGK